MAIERFSREQFEAALPNKLDKPDEPARPLWSPLGLERGEYCYLVQPYPNSPYAIHVRSSVDASGIARDTADDSIRARICSAKAPYDFVGNKAKCWVTRVPGWEGRLTTLLRKLANAIRFAVPCPKCGKPLTPMTTKSKENGNAGRTFVVCDHCVNPPVNGEERGKSQVFHWCESEAGDFLELPAALKGKPAPKPATPATTAERCPNCHKPALMPNKLGPGFHCFKRLNGCGWTGTQADREALDAQCGTNDSEADTELTPNNPPPPAKPIAPTMAAFVEAVEVMMENLHEIKDGQELWEALRTHPTVATVRQQINNYHFARSPLPG